MPSLIFLLSSPAVQSLSGGSTSTVRASSRAPPPDSRQGFSLSRLPIGAVKGQMPSLPIHNQLFSKVVFTFLILENACRSNSYLFFV